jgi:hypothetical protein
MRNGFFFFVLTAFFLTSCRFGRTVKGNGRVTTIQRSVSDFSGISIVGDMDVYFTPGTAYSVRVEGDENLLEYIETANDGDMLEIGTRDHVNLRSSSPIKVHVSAPSVDELEMVGSGNFISQSKITSKETIKIDVTGSGNVKVVVDAPEVQAQISGSGDVQVAGTTRKFDAEVDGSGNVRCFDLLSEQTAVDVSGSGDAEVYASKELNIEINGSGNVAYKGSPSIKQNSSGSGSVRKAE